MLLSPDFHELVQTATNALGPIVLLFVARNVKDATKALNDSNALSAQNTAQLDLITKQYEKVKRDLDEVWARVRLNERLPASDNKVVTK